MLVKDIKPDAQSINVDHSLFYVSGTKDCIVKDRETLKQIVDSPCLEACEYLYDCNILTLNSSANEGDLQVGKGYITIDYDSLSEENKKIYQVLIDKKIVKPCREYTDTYGIINRSFDIEISFDEKTTDEEFSESLMKIVRIFEPQELVYGSFSKEEMLAMAIYAYDNDSYYYIDNGNGGCLSNSFYNYIDSKYNDGISKEELVTEYNYLFANYYYDVEKDRYWISKELYEKAINSKSKKR